MAKRKLGTSRRRTERTFHRGEEAGFTLIELLVVIIILGILSAVVVFAVRGVSDKGQSAALTADAKTVRTAQEAHCAKFGSYGTMDELVTKQLLSEKSTLTGVQLGTGGNCGTGPQSSFSLTAATATLKIAANADQWINSDTGSGPGYSSSAFTYPLNSNLNDPLIIMNSNYTLSGGLAQSWEPIPVSSNRAAFTSAQTPSAKPLPNRSYPGDRPFPHVTWRFHLRQGVKFHNGQPFDADDVIWTWRDRQPLSGSGSSGQNTLGFSMKIAAQGAPEAFDSVEKIDQFTVDITPKIVNLRFPEQVLHPKGAIVQVLRDGVGAPVVGPFGALPGLSSPRTLGRHLDGSTGGVGTPSLPVITGGGTATATPLVLGTPQGTGPFKFVSYKPTNPQGGGTASFLAHPEYWGSAKAQVKGMDYTFIADPAVRTAGLQSGQYDFAMDLNPLDTGTVQGTGGRVVTAPYGQNSLIYVNKVVKTSPATLDMTKVGPATPANYTFNITTDQAVRRAVSLSLDRNAYTSAIFAGNAAPGRWMGPPNILGPYQNLVTSMAHDVNLARTTLDAAGWTCGGAAPGLGTACAANETRAWRGADTTKFATGRSLTLYMVGISLVPQSGYDLMTAQMKTVGINLVAQRGTCDGSITCPDGSVGRGLMYNSTMWDLDVELPNQNDANAAFLPVLRQACVNELTTFRFAPADGVNGIGPAVADTAGNGGGTFPFGKTPCVSPGVALGPMDTTWVPQSLGATTQDSNQQAAANMMRILVNQDQTNVVIPIVGQFRIYGMSGTINLGDPHPSQTSQRWLSLSKSAV